MFRYIQRRRIKKVIKLLSAKMVKSYGSRDFFSIGQVETSSRELSKRQQQIALASVSYTHLTLPTMELV